MKKALVSVVIPTYNRAKIISNALESVLSQTYTNLEIIVVDDASNDNTFEIVKKYQQENKNISYYYHNSNKGVSSARNLGIKKSQGQYIAFLDSDDQFVPNKIEYQLQVMRDKNVHFSLCNSYKIFTHGRKIIQFKSDFFIKAEHVINLSIPISASNIIISKNVTTDFCFDENLLTANDFDFVLRYVSRQRVLFISKPLSYIYRDLDGNRISTDYSKKIQGLHSIKNNMRIYKLSKKQEKQLQCRLDLNIGLFLILQGKYANGRDSLKNGLQDIKFSLKKIKFQFLYLVSFSPVLLKFFINVAKKMWQLGILKT